MDIKQAYEIIEMERRLRGELVVSRLEKGETLMQIADDMGITWQRVQRIAKRAGYNVRERKAARKNTIKAGEALEKNERETV